MREIAPRRIKEILAQIQQQASADTGSADGSADGTLSAQLEIAVNTLSQGLVERDTEVHFLSTKATMLVGPVCMHEGLPANVHIGVPRQGMPARVHAGMHTMLCC